MKPLLSPKVCVCVCVCVCVSGNSASCRTYTRVTESASNNPDSELVHTHIQYFLAVHRPPSYAAMSSLETVCVVQRLLSSCEDEDSHPPDEDCHLSWWAATLVHWFVRPLLYYTTLSVIFFGTFNVLCTMSAFLWSSPQTSRSPGPSIADLCASDGK